MRKHLFLVGPSSSSLSAMLREALGPALSIAGGYVTEKVSAADEALRVVLLPAAAAGGVSGFAGQVIYDCSSGTAQKDNEVFRSEGVRLLQEASYYPFAVLDRIGGYELVIPQFRQALADLLSSDLPLLGIVFSREEAYALGSSLGLGERYEALVDRLHEALRENPDTLLVQAADQDADTAKRLILQWAQEYVYS